LAWEFALRKIYPEETLEAAKRAHELSPDDPNIMDTLAEAYYAAGNYEMAVYWEKKALEKEPENEFFKKQLKKFMRALKNK
jgi:tetratricopeptide (TPR) repeat protein